MTYIGQPQVFNPDIDDWDIFNRKVDVFLKVNDIVDDKHTNVLLSLLCQVTFRLLIDLCNPGKPEQKTYAELVKLLSDHYSLKHCVFKERYFLYQANRNIGEAVNVW